MTSHFLQRGYSVWKYTRGQWVLKQRQGITAAECGGPPREPGRFEGDVRKTLSRRRMIGAELSSA